MAEIRNKNESGILRSWPDKEAEILVLPKVIFGKEERIVYIDGVISRTTGITITPKGIIHMVSASSISDALIQLDRESEDPIKIVIDSGGGDLLQGFKIIDTILNLRSPVWMIIRECASLATVVAVLGADGHRYVLKDAYIHLHGPSLGIGGKQADVRETLRYLEKFGQKLLDLLLERTKLAKVGKVRSQINLALRANPELAGKELQKKKREALAEWLHKERFFTAEEAIQYGIADQILTPELQQRLFGVKKGE